MEKVVGCIISDTKLKEFKDDYWSYTPIHGKPTLYVGYDNASNNISSFNVTRRVYDDCVWWCFGKREKRKDYLEVSKKFKEAAFRKAAASVKYEYINFICYTESRVKALIRYIKGPDKKVCFITRGGQFVFIFSEKYNTVWGLSLSLCEYVGIDSSKVIERMRSNPRNHFIKNTNFIDSEMRSIIGNDTHFIPVLATYKKIV